LRALKMLSSGPSGHSHISSSFAVHAFEFVARRLWFLFWSYARAGDVDFNGQGGKYVNFAWI
jgi:hypothetical protein